MSLQFKQRLTGTIAIIALVVIFVPMLFDEPVKPSNKTIEIQFPNPSSHATNKSIPRLNEMNQALENALSEQESNFNGLLAEKQQIAKTMPKNSAITTTKPDDTKTIQELTEPSKKLAEKKTTNPNVNIPAANTTKTKKFAAKKTTEPNVNIIAKNNSIAKQPTVIEPEHKPSVSAKTVLENIKAKSYSKSLYIRPAELARKAWSVQLGAFSNRANAYLLVEDLKRKGYKSYTVNKYYNDKSLTLVYVGPEFSKDRAKNIQVTLLKQLHIKGMVVAFNIAK